MYRRCLGSEACCRSTCLIPQFDLIEGGEKQFPELLLYGSYEIFLLYKRYGRVELQVCVVSFSKLFATNVHSS